MTGESQPQQEKPYELSGEGLVEATNQLVTLAEAVDAYHEGADTAIGPLSLRAEQDEKRVRYAYDIATGILDKVLPRRDGTWHGVIEELRSVRDAGEQTAELENDTSPTQRPEPEYMD